MNNELLKRYLDLQDCAYADEKYQLLYQEYQDFSQRFLLLLENLTEEQQDTILHYIRTCSDLHLRLMELACEKMA